MDVFLVPTGIDCHELYCEIASAPPAAEERPGTLRGRVGDWFRRTLADAEAARQLEGSAGTAPQRSRWRRALTRHLAEAVA
jgi:hypothetical protein